MSKITQNVVETLRCNSEALAWWEVNEPLYADLISKLEELGFEASLSTTGVDIRGMGNKEMFTNAFRVLRAAGFNTSRRPEDKETYFTCFFSHEGLKDVWFSFSSTVCRRVQVGTEYKEVPVYEVRCEETDNG